MGGDIHLLPHKPLRGWENEDFTFFTIKHKGRGRAVGIVTHYELKGPGIESRTSSDWSWAHFVS